MEKILVLCPTRARPENAKRLKHNFAANTKGDTDLVFCIDDNDPKLVDYLVMAQEPGFYYKTDTPKRLGPWLNYWVDKISEYDIVGFVGDDVLARTWNFDDRIREAMVPNGIVYGNDGWQGQNLPTSVFMDARMVEKAGYMVYPKLTHLYIDNHWKAWGEALGTLKYLEDVHLEHMHPFAGKAENDKVYEDANTPLMYSKDGQAFEQFVKRELPKLVKRLA